MFNIISQKQCTKCREWRDRGEFHKDRTRKDGLTPQCKVCKRLYAKENSVKLVKRALEWNKCNPEKHKQHRKEYSKEYYHKNIERFREIGRKLAKKWYADKGKERNKKSLVAATRKWRASHREKSRAHDRNRRARKLSNGGTVTAAEWKMICDKYKNKCIVPGCGGTDVTMDHVIPLALGGCHSVENVQPLCRHHNFSKGTKVIDYRNMVE
jgi:hypothetical protein